MFFLIFYLFCYFLLVIFVVLCMSLPVKLVVIVNEGNLDALRV
jgi:hypothetical protein